MRTPRLESLVAALAVLALAACASAPPAPLQQGPREIALKNPGFEADMPANMNCAPGWSCSAHVDATSFAFTVDASGAAEGSRSFRLQRVKLEPWALVVQAVEDPKLRGKRLRFSLSVRTEGVTEGGGIFLVVQNAGGRTMAHDKKLLKGTQGWTRQSLEFTVPEGASLFEVGATMEGAGTLWLDAARLEIVGP